MFNRFRKQSGTAPVGTPEFLVVGLGNPGNKYTLTRHNAGFLCLDMLSQKQNFKIDRLKFKSLISDTAINGHRCIVMKPQTFMNNSGEAVRECAAFYKIPPENIIVIYDDISLDVGKLRIRRKGSDGGHNGIKNIIYLSGSNEFPRVKIGIGQKPDGWDLADWVLGRYSDEDLKTLEPVFKNTVEALKLIMDGKTEEAMGKFN